MNATNLYMNTCRLVMQADIESYERLGELHKVLPYLRQSLTCTVCGRILTNPYTPTESTCQHHVCKHCIGGKKRLKPSCSWCRNYETYIENSQMQLIIKCYKKLCSYVKTSCLYNKLSSIITNGNNCNIGLTDIIDEALSEISRPLSSEYDKSYRPFGGLSCNPVHSVEEHLGLESEYKCIDSPISATLLVHSSKSRSNADNSDCKLGLPIVGDDLEFKHDLNDQCLSQQSFQTNVELDKSVSPLLTVDSSDIAPLLEPSTCNDNLVSSILPNEIYVDPLFLTETDVSVDSVTESLPTSNFSVSVTSPTLTTSVPTSIEESDDKTKTYNNVFRSTPVPALEQDINSLPSISTISRCVTKVLNSVDTSIPLSSTCTAGVSSATNNNNNNSYESSYIPSVVPNNVSVIPMSQSSLITDNTENVKLSNIPFSQSSSVINSVSVIPSVELSNLSNASTAITCVLNIPPGTILTSANVKQSVRESIFKHGSSINNGSSLYSVLYNNSDSTKITIKRKPPDIENVKKFPGETEKFTRTLSSQEVIKKIRPKPKPKPKRKGCRCGNATPTPGKLTCCGQRCPCYVEAKACIECQCRGCRNPHRPGGKKVRPVIPQLGNIQIHQVQPVHPRVAAISSSLSNSAIHSSSIGTMATHNPIMTASGSVSQTIRAVHAMHAVQAVQGFGQIHGVQGSMHQLINIGSGIIDSPMTSALNIHPDLSLKPVNLTLSSVPTHLLINDDKSTSNSASDNSDVDIDI